MELVLISLFGLLSHAHAADCADPVDEVARAEDLVLFADLEGTRSALGRVEQALGCSGPAEPLLLGRMWLVEGALYADSGDVTSAAVSFAAAGRVAPGLWIEALGPERKKVYDASQPKAPEKSGQVAVDAPPGVTGTIWVDGLSRTDPLVLPAGVWLIQFGADGLASFARIVLVAPDQVLHVEVPPAPMAQGEASALTQAAAATEPSPPARPVAAPDPAVPPAARAGTWAYPHLAVGVDLTFGGSLAQAFQLERTEPATIVTVPVELGGGAAGRLAWVRAAASVAPVFAGRIVYTSPDGVAERPGFSVGGHIAGGLSAGPMDFGLLGGYEWPGRAVTRATVGLNVPGAPVAVEVRGGVEVLADGSLKPAASVVVAFPGARRKGR